MRRRQTSLQAPNLAARRFDDGSAVSVVHLRIGLEPRDAVFQLVNIAVDRVPALAVAFEPSAKAGETAQASASPVNANILRVNIRTLRLATGMITTAAATAKLMTDFFHTPVRFLTLY
jgi:hypothetical protein